MNGYIGELTRVTRAKEEAKSNDRNVVVRAEPYSTGRPRQRMQMGCNLNTSAKGRKIRK